MIDSGELGLGETNPCGGSEERNKIMIPPISGTSSRSDHKEACAFETAEAAILADTLGGAAARAERRPAARTEAAQQVLRLIDPNDHSAK